jgi:hypothetical protein
MGGRHHATVLSDFGKNRIASVGQASQQAPHEMHLSWWITCFSLTTPVIASTGHALKQAWQPSHFSSMIS